MRGHHLDPEVVSLALFNNAALAEVLVSADRILSVTPHTVTTRQVAAATGRSDSVVRPVMMRLLSGGLLSEPAQVTGRGPRPFARAHQELWERLLAVTAVIYHPEPA
ncbi:hypothetical protein [uncultured Nocardioides sp.]|uniref:hypothetical protein n=1 Tax=uncultured Nocardioides sp. TaxID=198441 RepID=UPI00262FD805|nr:hypothetical protein [uncultured Nocardioides sp.]